MAVSALPLINASSLSNCEEALPESLAAAQIASADSEGYDRLLMLMSMS
jgi:hypothetical protein